MKRFYFPLRSVAVLREHQKVRARETFAAGVHAYVEAESALAETRRRVVACESALHEVRQATYRPSEAASQLAAYRRECEVEMAGERAVFAAHAEMEKRRTAYLEAHRKVEVLQRLEEKARTTHRLDNLRHEQAGFDDFANRRRVSPATYGS